MWLQLPLMGIVMIRTKDIDFVVLRVSTYIAVGQKINELWIAFGMWCSYRYIPVQLVILQ